MEEEERSHQKETFLVHVTRAKPNMTNWRILAVVLLIVGIAGLLTVSLLYGTTGGDIPFDHGIVIDAGSTHSSVFLYEWKGDKYKGTGCVKQLEECKVSGGLSEYENSENAAKSLLPCLDTISHSVPAEKKSSTPVYLAATAGLRLLNISNPKQNTETLFAIKCILPKSGFDVKNASIISGGEEGLTGWITANFLLKHLQRREHSTAGALDFGGASTQISYEVPESQHNESDVFHLKLYGENYYVFSVSYLCYGVEKIYDRYLAILLGDDPNRQGPIPSPCAHKGFSEKYTAEYLFTKPCTTTDSYEVWVDHNKNKLNQTYTFEGTSDVTECKRTIAEVYDYNKCNGKFQECFKRTDRIFDSATFIAFSNYYFTLGFFNSINTKNVTQENYQDFVDEYCALPWNEAQNVTSPIASSAYNKVYCFRGQAISHLLAKGYNFDSKTWENLIVTRKVNDVSLGWSLGYMINATNAIPEEMPTPPIIGLIPFIIILLICVVLFILVFVFFKRHRLSKKSTMPNV